MNATAPVRCIIAAASLNLLLLCLPLAILAASQRPRIDGCTILFLLLMFGWSLHEGARQPGRGAQPPRAGGIVRLPTVLALALPCTFWIAMSEHATARNHAIDATGAAGGALIIVGALLRVAAMRALGPAFLDEVALLAHQRIVTGGVYRHLRHPSETGTLCITLGGVLLLHSPLAAAWWLGIVFPCIVLRVRREDALLAEHDPTTFSDYSRRVWALVPRVPERVRAVPSERS